MYAPNGEIKSLNMILAIKVMKNNKLELKIYQTFGDGINSQLIVKISHIKNSIVHPTLYFCVIFDHVYFQII